MVSSVIPPEKATKSILKKSKASSKSRQEINPVVKIQAYVSLRRTMIDKFRRNKAKAQDVNNDNEVDSMKVIRIISLKSKKIKDHQQNAEAMEEYNKGHEDDLCSDGVQTGQKLLKMKKWPLLDAPD